MPSFASRPGVVPSPPGPVPASDLYAGAGVEPPLREVLADPVVHAVMRRDRIGPDEVWAAVRAARQALNGGGAGADGGLVKAVYEAPSQVG